MTHAAIKKAMDGSLYKGEGEKRQNKGIFTEVVVGSIGVAISWVCKQDCENNLTGGLLSFLLHFRFYKITICNFFI